MWLSTNVIFEINVIYDYLLIMLLHNCIENVTREQFWVLCNFIYFECNLTTLYILCVYMYV